MMRKSIDIRIIYPYICFKNKSYEKKSFSSSDYFGLFGWSCLYQDIVDIIRRLPQLAFDNIEALASGESSAYRCYGIGDVDCHGYKVDKMYSGYSLK